MSQRHDMHDQGAPPMADLYGDATGAEAPREAFQAAFDAIGGAQALAHWGHSHPAQFYAILARLLGPGGRGEAVLAEVSDVPLGTEPMSVEEWRQTVLAWQRDGGRS